MTVVLEEMDIAREKRKPRPGGKPPVRTATGTHPSSWRRPSTVRRATRGRLCPGGRLPSGPGFAGHRGAGDDEWIGQTDGSIGLSRRYLAYFTN